MPLRRAAVAGSWYPGDAPSLAAEVERHLHAVPPAELPGPLLALISPHAGLTYSGPVAAYGYAFLRGTSGLTAVLVGPSHRASFDGVSVFAHGAFETPLGALAVDEVAARALVDAHPRIRDFATPHREEHSLEMQLPFLQHLVRGLRVVPVLMGRQTREDVDALAGALAQVLPGRDAFMVASSDLSHYHPAPVAQAMDSEVLADIARFDPESLMDRLETEPGHACGGGPMVAVMKAARALGAERAIVMRYGDSGDAGELNKRRVVGYVSAALTKASE
jgi:AmmeMemoRadiSam system protein B